MDTPITVAIISAAAAIGVSTITFYLTKKKEREADWRRYKVEQYKEFITALSGIVGGDSTPDGQRRFALACNTTQLLASQKVIQALRDFRSEIDASNVNTSRERHDTLLSRLVSEIRMGIKLPGKQDTADFEASLWCSGVASSGPAINRESGRR